MGSVTDISDSLAAVRGELTHFLEIDELNCGHIEQLVDYFLDSELPQTLHERVSQHLSQCQVCAQLVADLQMLVDMAKRLRERPVPEDVRERLHARLSEEASR